MFSNCKRKKGQSHLFIGKVFKNWKGRPPPSCLLSSFFYASSLFSLYNKPPCLRQNTTQAAISVQDRQCRFPRLRGAWREWLEEVSGEQPANVGKRPLPRLDGRAAGNSRSNPPQWQCFRGQPKCVLPGRHARGQEEVRPRQQVLAHVWQRHLLSFPFSSGQPLQVWLEPRWFL